MKVKTRPDDFQVEELTDLRPGNAGSFALYELRKRDIGTPEAMQAISREWRIAWHRLSYGGLKDRHAVTLQYFTIRHGPQRDLQRPQFRVKYLGQSPTPFDPAHIRMNRFQIVLRDMAESEVQTALQAAAEVRHDGVPNYFDDQRFGSVSVGRQFVARQMIDGDYEAALRLALAEPYEFDRAAQKQEKRILRASWGDWPAAKAALARGHARSIVTYLADHPTDFRGAVARLRADLKSLYLAAYQSHLWNCMLSQWLSRHCRPEQLQAIDLRLGPALFCYALDETQRAGFQTQKLPLPSARLKINAEDPLAGIITDVLRAEGLELSQIRLKHFREPFFAKGERAALMVPRGLDAGAEPDEMHAGKRKLVLSFDLPRGSYATMVIKRLVMSKESYRSDVSQD